MSADDSGSGVAPPGRGVTARRIVLGTQLRQLRERAGITRADAGYAIRASESKVSRLELGRVAFKERDIDDLLVMYGISDKGERGAFLELVGQANQPGWWRRFSGVMPNWFNDFVGLEESAARIQTYELLYVPGLLQTEAYARAIVTRGRSNFVPPDAERRIALRMQRQRIISGIDPPKVWMVVDHSVLERPIGGRAVLKEQLEHLLVLSEQSNITLQVVPPHLSGYAAEGAFTILRFAEAELLDVVYVEHLSGAHYLDSAEDLETYGRALDRLMVDAETPDRTRQVIQKAITEL